VVAPAQQATFKSLLINAQHGLWLDV